jgi:vacuolar-type H+-ATPase subunit E/Vma4
VAYLRRKPRQQSQEQVEGDSSDSSRAREALIQYSMKDDLAAAEGGMAVPAEPADNEDAGPIDAELPADVASVGQEVGTVLKSAQEAASRIHRAAEREAERLRKEAEATTAAAVAEARRDAEADRAEGSRVRAEAETYAKSTRAAADAFAEQRRSDADREAAQIVGDAQRRLANADAEVEQKMRQATAKEHVRIEALQAEVAHYEQRLESILVVFRGVTSQLEDLLGKRDAERSVRLDEVSDEALEHALQPDRAGSRAG